MAAVAQSSTPAATTGGSLIDEIVHDGARRMPAGAVEVVARRVNARRVDEATSEQRPFSSAVLPAWCRMSSEITEVLPPRYLHGLSSQDFVAALKGFLSTGSGLSAVVVARLTAGLATVAKLIEAAQARWRAVDAPHLATSARARFERSKHAGRVPQEAA